MTKMSNAQRFAILRAHEARQCLGRMGMVSADPRTERVLRRRGWVAGTFDIPTRAGLIAAGVDLDALHGEALDEHAERGHVDNRAEIGAARTQRFHALVKTTRSFAGAMAILHVEALAEDFTRRPFMVRAQEIGAAERARAAARLNALHAEALDEHAERSAPHVRDNCPALANGGCMRCTAPATVRAARGEDLRSYQNLGKLLA